MTRLLLQAGLYFCVIVFCYFRDKETTEQTARYQSMFNRVK